MSNETKKDADVGRLEHGVRRSAPKRDSAAMWANLLVAHAWGAACYVRPGWFPTAVSLVSILIAGLILYEDQITKALELLVRCRGAGARDCLQCYNFLCLSHCGCLINVLQYTHRHTNQEQANEHLPS
jgi:hypothetical protein